ncbi:DDE-type integrase/transposase/recombinase [Roseibium sp. RKSG952]|uniref:DDE-type integrase/transposase/recombinase n=1 Tax=Roseibium sp. RKSG952 TaxID=2529384 RepID=UPI0012BBBEEE|nr:DDE-type integrase/transposase/recombinase [Roseibium sp. RKSG952]MTH95270.1 transposase [Roseibium sp. RKSG952]
MGNRGIRLPSETLLSLRTRLNGLPARSAARREEVARIAALFGVSSSTVYRALSGLHRPKPLRRSDRGRPRGLPEKELERYCEIIAALKIRTRNRNGRHLSTNRAIEILEEHGVETPQGFIQPEKSLLKRSTVNRWLKDWGLDHPRMTRAVPPVHFEAQQSNSCWQFDMSPSDLKHIKQPEWIDPKRGDPTLTLFSVVDDRSGTAYQEYRCVYGEDAESALRFLFNAMASKDDTEFQGIPEMLYMDNGPVAKSLVFQSVMEKLGVKWQTHMPAGSDGNRVTARSKGKVERPFRTVKEAHETLYHFHQPETEAEANLWLRNFINKYNDKPHRREAHSRIEDWIANLPSSGLREMCTWERFCAFAREPECRKVAADARVSVGGAYYEVDSDLAGEDVLLWWGLFDHELFVEWNDKRYGPFRPYGGPIPLHRYRKRKPSRREIRAQTVAKLAEQISVPKSALSGSINPTGPLAEIAPLSKIRFSDPDPWGQINYETTLSAKRAISYILDRPLAELNLEDREFITGLVNRTLNKSEIKIAIRQHFRRS